MIIVIGHKVLINLGNVKIMIWMTEIKESGSANFILQGEEVRYR